MGEAKQKSKRLGQFIKRHPYCCFCGGVNPTETIDHVPAKIMFRQKHRPEGLESPACQSCNQSTKSHEQVAAMLARIDTDTRSAIDREEISKLMKAVSNNRPMLFAEMKPSWRQEYDFYNSLNLPQKAAGAFNASGPLLNESIQIFGAKLCYAYHYHHTKQIVPVNGGVGIRWYTNWDKYNNQLPDDLIGLFKDISTLRQGQWSVEKQFSYSYITTSDSTMAVYYTVFNDAFAVAGFVVHDIKKIAETKGLNPHRPGQKFTYN